MEAIFDSLSSISHGSLVLLVNSLAIGVLVAGIVIVLYRFIRPRDAATSYIVWWVVLSAVIILPVATCMYVGSASEAARAVEFSQAKKSDSRLVVMSERAGDVKGSAKIIRPEPSEPDRTVGQFAEAVAERLKGVVEDRAPGARVLGPAPAPLSKLRGKYRFHLQLQGPDGAMLRDAVRQATEGAKPPEGVHWIADVDPLDML